MSYFPAGALFAPPYLEEWAILGLLEFDEPSLYVPAQPWPGTVYRLLYLPVFERRVLIRLTLNAEAGHLIVKRPVTGSDNAIWTEERRPLTLEEAQQFKSVVETADFWHLPTAISFDYERTRDGDTLIFEGRQGTLYHVTGRSGGVEDEPLLPIVHAMMCLAGLQKQRR